jgi:hypothetical protein
LGGLIDDCVQPSEYLRVGTIRFGLVADRPRRRPVSVEGGSRRPRQMHFDAGMATPVIEIREQVLDDLRGCANMEYSGLTRTASGLLPLLAPAAAVMGKWAGRDADQPGPLRLRGEPTGMTRDKYGDNC